MIGMTAPHYAASEAGYKILQEGGTAIEAMVAAAATIAVVYPHMNGLGGDGFWLISEPGKRPIAIDASGVSCQNATPDFYQEVSDIPSRGGRAALTMAGAVAGWEKALQYSANWQAPLPLDDLLIDAITHAKQGISVTQSLEDASNKTFEEFKQDPHFSVFRNNGKPLRKGEQLLLPKLAETLSHLGKVGLDDFYHGEIAAQLAADLTGAGSPIRVNDFESYQALEVAPLELPISVGNLYNLPAPTQGIASMMILGLFDRLRHHAKNEAEFIHIFVECTKLAFIVRNDVVTDNSRLNAPLTTYLQSSYLDELASKVQLTSALPWPHRAKLGDTVWMGACDGEGRMVSYIQSLYWEFGSGVVSPSTGIVWNNRGTSFSLVPTSNQLLQPGLKPFHTLNPAYAEFKDGSRMVYGTMGGEGQPQTQGTLFCRHVWQSTPLAKSISMPRWLLGRTWGDVSHNLKIEEDTDKSIIQQLEKLGHDIALVPKHAEMMGHAGAIKLTNNKIEAATDPRSDGKAFATGNPQ